MLFYYEMKRKATAVWVIVEVLIFTMAFVKGSSTNMDMMDRERQQKLLDEKKRECFTYLLDVSKTKLNRSTSVMQDKRKCPPTWDDIMCWPETDPGVHAHQHCPDYIMNFNIEGLAYRYCTPSGTWWINPIANSTWTNFTACTSPRVPKVVQNDLMLFQKHLPHMRMTYNIGYGLSLFSLVLAVTIMVYFKRVHCPRNTIHINLFFSFILRAVTSFVRENATVQSVGFPSDIRVTVNNTIEFRDDVSHWGCKMFFTLLNYIIAASYTWIFVEALYLHMLISVSVFSEKSRLRWYIMFGWGSPVVFIIPWVIVRSFIANEDCWNTYTDQEWILWIIYGPVTIFILINIFIFLNMVRVLFTKLTESPCPETRRFRYRRLAKSTLILIPLFGVYYVLFWYTHFANIKYEATVIFLYIEMGFNSFQGFFLSLLFCFMNTEIRNELKKFWRKHWSLRASSYTSHRSKLSFNSKTKFTKEDSRTHLNGGNHSIKPNVEPIPLDGQNGNEQDVNWLENGSSNVSCHAGKAETTFSEEKEFEENIPCLNKNKSRD